MVVEWTRLFEDLLVKTSSPYTLIRASVGGYDEHGRYQEPVPTQSTIQAHIQPANGIEINDLPEGRRGRDTIKIYADDELRTIDQINKTQPDLIIYNGKTYQIDRVWFRNVHYKALATRVEDAAGR